MTNFKSDKPYDLEVRTEQFARDGRTLVRQLPKTVTNIEDGRQLVRSMGSTAANYIESVEALSRKDALMRLRICRKEAKESGLWLRLVETGDSTELQRQRDALVKESQELRRIFTALIDRQTKR